MLSYLKILLDCTFGVASSNKRLFVSATISTVSPPDKLGLVVNVILSNATVYYLSDCNTPSIRTSTSPDGC